ncbi:class I SAM-dependent methyltransferase [Nocardioides sp. BP30]|uniref:class I SAM-dependent methyltransferase n=1 Tax=Nocardioides sp. BP30 TaxID=3036374 RepID=UPI0024698145|nr:class I SAM-dependent methyltransferase [Nocardioides sp. BP30]WGL51171.1 class I SAM-dependent methyltransferase [Nocardioides sp. BP30]
MTTTDQPVQSPRASWAHLDRVPSGPAVAVTARIARRLFVHAVERLDVTVRLEGRTVGRGGPEMVIHRPEEFFARLGRDKLVGFGEAYLTGAWDAEDLAGFLAVLAAEVEHLTPRWLQAVRGLAMPRTPARDRGARRDTQRNIAHHYDLSNEFFALFLDPTMSYSAAWFRAYADGRPAIGDDLEHAQRRKIDALLDLARVGHGTRLLEIGTGWGQLAIMAAERGAQVHTVTLSVEQRALAMERIAAAGLSDRIEVELCDYREIQGQYDAIVSVEMIEAVGWRHWGTYFGTLDRLLAPYGAVALQAITMPHRQMLATRDSYTWINKYIFPGGFLPSEEALAHSAGEHGLRMTHRTSLGAHYAETLRQWDERFRAASTEVAALGFDGVFERMWHFYLEYSRAGFVAGYLDDLQLRYEREATA